MLTGEERTALVIAKTYGNKLLTFHRGHGRDVLHRIYPGPWWKWLNHTRSGSGYGQKDLLFYYKLDL